MLQTAIYLSVFNYTRGPHPRAKTHLSLVHLHPLQGKQLFSGTVVHVRDFPGPQAAHSLDVLVVGSGKEAQDCAVALAESKVAHSVTSLFKQVTKTSSVEVLHKICTSSGGIRWQIV